MNLRLTLIFVLNILRILVAHPPNIDINRIKQLTANTRQPYLFAQTKSNSIRSITPETPKALKIYPPHQDPRLFYLSAAYTKYNSDNKTNNEVSAVYPGRDVIRADERRFDNRLDRLRGRGHRGASKGGNVCMRCPRDRTLVAKGGSNKVLLQAPRLTSCSGRPAPWNVHFMHMYGPSFGSLLEKGSHTIVGKITLGNTTLQQCKLQINVILQGCHVPKHLKADCEDRDSKCNFRCRDNKHKLQGKMSLLCGDDLKWSGPLPQCITARSCAPLWPKERGRISCQGPVLEKIGVTGEIAAFGEGARCRIRCPRGWRSNSKDSPSLCRHGDWSKTLTCLPKRNNTAQKRAW